MNLPQTYGGQVFTRLTLYLLFIYCILCHRELCFNDTSYEYGYKYCHSNSRLLIHFWYVLHPNVYAMNFCHG